MTDDLGGTAPLRQLDFFAALPRQRWCFTPVGALLPLTRVDAVVMTAAWSGAFALKMLFL